MDARVVDPLSKALDDKDDSVRENARKALNKLKRNIEWNKLIVGLEDKIHKLESKL